MNCYLHPETPAVAFCRTCGRSLCAVCQRPAEGTVFCQDHVPVVAGYGAVPPQGGPEANPYFATGPVPPAAVPVRTSPGLAFLLGFIPGVGAIYNGQYIKGLVHALVFGLLVTILDTAHGGAEPLLGILMAAFIFYMPFEAYHTAKKREMGLVPDEWSSILPQTSRGRSRAPIGPIVLIGVGVLYLLNSLNLVDFQQIGRFWPVILIVVGAYLLYARVSGKGTVEQPLDRPDVPRSSSEFMGTRHE